MLILDEPTTSLNNDEVEHLFQIIRRLKEKGTAFIFISHKMPEIFRIADRYTVLRNGEFIKSGKLSEITQEEVPARMQTHILVQNAALSIVEPITPLEEAK